MPNSCGICMYMKAVHICAHVYVEMDLVSSVYSWTATLGQAHVVFSMQGKGNMNTTEPDSNFTANKENVTLSNLTTAISATISQSPPYSSGDYDPAFTIMVVLGLSLTLAGLAAFLAVCRPSEHDADSEASCSPRERLTGGRSRSSEPQLKVWKRLGSYRRSHNLSFRRPPQRRPHEQESTHSSRSPSRQTPQPEASVQPNLTVPCLFDYVTEIWLGGRKSRLKKKKKFLDENVHLKHHLQQLMYAIISAWFTSTTFIQYKNCLSVTLRHSQGSHSTRHQNTSDSISFKQQTQWVICLDWNTQKRTNSMIFFSLWKPKLDLRIKIKPSYFSRERDCVIHVVNGAILYPFANLCALDTQQLFMKTN